MELQGHGGGGVALLRPHSAPWPHEDVGNRGFGMQGLGLDLGLRV